ncbi:MAG TPA: LuxR C-terminal-related transcriptional regulator, partial [Pseudonocardiaceae bacterium]|nr:LuxR C-terminal-related transcriptional regulator [Pseudonocardiaceae bacterium]
EIARRLVLSPNTVRNHVSNVFAKLRVAGRAEAVAQARDAGLVPDLPCWAARSGLKMGPGCR